LLLTCGQTKLLRAILPIPPTVYNPSQQRRAVAALLESLSLCLDTRLRVVLSADEPEISFCLGLIDGRGRGSVCDHYSVELEHRCPWRPVSKTAAECELKAGRLLP